MASNYNNDDEIRLGYLISKDYENGKMVYESEFKALENYLCGHLTSWSPNRGYYYDLYNKFSNIQIVARWRKKHGRVAGAKLGERICYRQYSEGELMNIIENKSHAKYCHYCRH